MAGGGEAKGGGEAVRAPEPREWIPADYFRRATAEEVFPGSFRDGRRCEIDLGCGDGTFLAAMAAAHPATWWLGIERLLGRVRKCARKAERAGLENVRLLRLEASYAVEWLLPHAAFDRVHILFPDPWPKKRHRGKRLLRRALLPCLAALLRPGGDVLFKTDDAGYDAWVAEETGVGGWRSVDWPADADPYPRTDFEEQWLSLGRPIHWRRLLPAARISAGESGPDVAGRGRGGR